MRVLVGYATAQGSTRATAEQIGDRLRRHGLDVEVRDLDGGVSVGGADAVVLGSAVHGRRWLPGARAFVAANAPELAAVPLWLFSVGMGRALRRPFRVLLRAQADLVVAEFTDRLSFRDHRAFSGVVRDDDLSATGRLLLRLMCRGAGDHRDPGAVDEWADGIARVLTSLPRVRDRSAAAG